MNCFFRKKKCAFTSQSQVSWNISVLFFSKHFIAYFLFCSQRKPVVYKPYPWQLSTQWSVVNIASCQMWQKPGNTGFWPPSHIAISWNWWCLNACDALWQCASMTLEFARDCDATRLVGLFYLSSFTLLLVYWVKKFTPRPRVWHLWFILMTYFPRWWIMLWFTFKKTKNVASFFGMKDNNFVVCSELKCIST